MKHELGPRECFDGVKRRCIHCKNFFYPDLIRFQTCPARCEKTRLIRWCRSLLEESIDDNYGTRDSNWYEDVEYVIGKMKELGF